MRNVTYPVVLALTLVALAAPSIHLSPFVLSDCYVYIQGAARCSLLQAAWACVDPEKRVIKAHKQLSPVDRLNTR